MAVQGPPPAAPASAPIVTPGADPDWVEAVNKMVPPPKAEAAPPPEKKEVAPAPAPVAKVEPAKQVAPAGVEPPKPKIDEKGAEAVHQERKKLAAENVAERQKLDTDRKAFDTERAQHQTTLAEWTGAKSNARRDPDAVLKAAGLTDPADRLLAAQRIIAEHSKDPRLQKYVADVEEHRLTRARADELEKRVVSAEEKLAAKEKADTEAAERKAFDDQRTKYTAGLAEEFKKIDAARFPLTAAKGAPPLLFDAAMSWLKANADEERDPTMDEIYAVAEAHYDALYDDDIKTYIKGQKKAPAQVLSTTKVQTQKADEKMTAPATLTTEHAPRITPQPEGAQSIEELRRIADHGLATGEWPKLEGK